MQQPDGRIERFDDGAMAEVESKIREGLTGKPHPVFFIGEELTIKGGRWRVASFKRNRMILKAVPY